MDRSVLPRHRDRVCAAEAARVQQRENGEHGLAARSAMLAVQWRAVRLILSRFPLVALTRMRQRLRRQRRDAAEAAARAASAAAAAAAAAATAAAAAYGTSVVSAAEPVAALELPVTPVGDAEAALFACKADSHEVFGSRSRGRLLSTRNAPVRAMTYAEFGRQGVQAAPALAASESEGSDIARAIAQAGALVIGYAPEIDGKDAVDDDDDGDDAEVEDQVDDDALPLRDNDVDGADDEAASDARSVSTASSAVLSAAAEAAHYQAKAAAAHAAAVAAAEANADDLALPESLSESTEGAAATVARLAARARAPPQGKAAEVLFVKAAGSAPGMLRLLPNRQIVWEPRDADAISPHAGASESAVSGATEDPFAGHKRDSVLPPTRSRRFRTADVSAIHLRCFRLNDTACEFFVSAFGGPRRRRYFFVFENTPRRDAFVAAVAAELPATLLARLLAAAQADGSASSPSVSVAGVGSGRRLTAASDLLGDVFGAHSGAATAYAYVQLPRTPSAVGVASGGFTHNYLHYFSHALPGLHAAWRARRLSNFAYLSAVNALAGRTFSDLTQYPVFPWVLADYSSPTLDLTRPSTFRDLSRPMGALTADRLREFRSRFESFDDDVIPPFMYGSHYSTGVGSVVHFLLRLHPFTAIHVDYQQGHFDVADRLFASVAEAWSMNTTSLSEVKELTPEFFSSPHFLVNSARYKFGDAQSGVPVDHVRLPPWARGSPARFVHLMRSALESEAASAALPAWIDLVFGHKQRGREAEKADNVFYYSM